MAKQILNEEFQRMQKLACVLTESEYKAKLNENIEDYYGEIQAVEDEFRGGIETGDYTEEEYLNDLLHVSNGELKDSKGGYYDIAKILFDLNNEEKKIAIKNIKNWAKEKLADINKNKMTKQKLNEEFQRMQKLAGIIIENYVVKANDNGNVIIYGTTEDEIYSKLVKKINLDPESWGYKVEGNILKDPMSHDYILSTNAKQYLMDLLKSEEGVGGTWILSKEEDGIDYDDENFSDAFIDGEYEY
jgi:hypothetical protein